MSDKRSRCSKRSFARVPVSTARLQIDWKIRRRKFRPSDLLGHPNIFRAPDDGITNLSRSKAVSSHGRDVTRRDVTMCAMFYHWGLLDYEIYLVNTGEHTETSGKSDEGRAWVVERPGKSGSHRASNRMLGPAQPQPPCSSCRSPFALNVVVPSPLIFFNYRRLLPGRGNFLRRTA